EAARLNAGCEGCHAQIGREWRDSWHARAHTDAAYQRALAIEPLRFCQGCHAPEADLAGPVPEAAVQLGVACVTCHVVQGQLLGATTPSGAAPHAVVRDARLDGNGACAACHEFEFPDRSARRAPELMQSTLSEHARSAQRDRTCASCHMPLSQQGGAAHRSHAFLGGHDTALVKHAVDVTAERHGDSARITLTPRDLGHAFPTGDLFRRLEVSAEAIGPEWQVSGSQRRFLTRHWQRLPSPFGVVLRSATRDDRPLNDALVVDLSLGPAAASLPIAWRVAYQRVEHPRSDHEDDSKLEGEIELASGTLEKP
ncbi:MAG TPA: multiheme c-type cytochrome, partial [Polyangiaceae bacterium]|nr:multiheme c-type cytochrome [Polyangiaceae bacterium]